MKNGFYGFWGHSLCRTGGLCLALSMMAAFSLVSVCSTRHGSRSLTPDSNAMSHNSSDSAYTEITVSDAAEAAFDDSGKMEKVCREYEERIQKEKKTSRTDQPATTEVRPPVTEAVPTQTTSSDDLSDEEKQDTLSTQSTTAVTSTDDASNDSHTTVTTTVTAGTAPTTSAHREPEPEHEAKISNGKDPFNYNDVSSIASHLSTLGDFVKQLSPDRISWDASDFSDRGCVRVTLESDKGIAVLDVKQTGNDYPGEDPVGSRSADGIQTWDWLNENQSAGCNISTVTWLSPGFGIAPVRGIGVGATLAQLTDNYLCINGGATTLYKASDVIEDTDKLNSLLAAENLYTFVGGRVYSIGSYLDKYYNGREHTFRFENCDYIVQYGCNSIMDHNYTTGSWIIEYAVMEDSVIGISFMNKSYYQTETKTAVSTNIPSSESESILLVTTHVDSSEAEVISDSEISDPIPSDEPAGSEDAQEGDSYGNESCEDGAASDETSEPPSEE